MPIFQLTSVMTRGRWTWVHVLIGMTAVNIVEAACSVTTTCRRRTRITPVVMSMMSMIMIMVVPMRAWWWRRGSFMLRSLMGLYYITCIESIFVLAFVCSGTSIFFVLGLKNTQEISLSRLELGKTFSQREPQRRRIPTLTGYERRKEAVVCNGNCHSPLLIFSNSNNDSFKVSRPFWLIEERERAKCIVVIEKIRCYESKIMRQHRA